MVESSHKNHLNRRRGISTVIGGIIFVVLLSAGFSSFFVAMDVQSDVVNAQKAVSDLLIDKAKEEFSIAASVDTNDANRLGIQLKNQGPNPVQVEDVWVITNSGNFPADKYLIDYQDSLIPSGYGSNILTNTPLFMAVDDYEIKVVSTLGTIKKVDLTVGASNNMKAELIAIPPDVKVGQNVTMIMHVENIGYSSLLNVIPFNDVTLDNYPSVTPPFTSANPPAAVAVDLDPGEGAFFMWEYITTGSTGSTVKFESYATAQEEDTGFIMNSNLAVEKIVLQEPDVTEIIVLEQDLFAKPELFVVIPSPMGTSPGDKGLWGANIVNPTPAPMTVSRLSITLLSPRENNSDLMFNPTSSQTAKCDPEAVGVTVDADWKCLTQNQLTWTNLASPITIPPFSAEQFTVLVHADRLSSNGVEIPAVIVVADVFTNLGEFSKAGYSSSFDDGGTVIANTYLADSQWSTLKADITTTELGIVSNSVNTFYATLTNFADDGHVIESGSKFIINIPKDWVIENPVTDIDGLGDFSTTHTVWADTSSQIVGTLLNDYDGTACCGRNAGEEGLSIKFTVRAPTVGNERMYVMYVLAEGLVDINDFSIGPLSEIVLQVVP